MTEKSTLVVTDKPLFLSRGVLELTPEQAGPRGRALKPVGRNVFEVVGDISFKAGERFGWVGAIPKALVDVLKPHSRPAARTTSTSTATATA